MTIKPACALYVPASWTQRRGGRKNGDWICRGKFSQFKIKVNKKCRASLVVQWLRICLPMQGTWVQFLVWEDPTCCGAMKPMCQSHWPLLSSLWASCNYRARVPWSPHSVTREAVPTRSPRTATKSSPCSPQPENTRSNEDPAQSKTNKSKSIFKKRD